MLKPHLFTEYMFYINTLPWGRMGGRGREPLFFSCYVGRVLFPETVNHHWHRGQLKYRWSRPMLAYVVKHLGKEDTRPEKPVNSWEEHVPRCRVQQVYILVMKNKKMG